MYFKAKVAYLDEKKKKKKINHAFDNEMLNITPTNQPGRKLPGGTIVNSICINLMWGDISHHNYWWCRCKTDTRAVGVGRWSIGVWSLRPHLTSMEWERVAYFLSIDLCWLSRKAALLSHHLPGDFTLIVWIVWTSVVCLLCSTGTNQHTTNNATLPDAADVWYTLDLFICIWV